MDQVIVRTGVEAQSIAHESVCASGAAPPAVGATGNAVPAKLAPVALTKVNAKGVFGEIQIRMSIKPLALNPKTSALTVWSAVRFLQSTGLGLIT